MFMKYFIIIIILFSLMQSGTFKVAQVLSEQSLINLLRDSVFHCILSTAPFFFFKCKMQLTFQKAA